MNIKLYDKTFIFMWGIIFTYNKQIYYRPMEESLNENHGGGLQGKDFIKDESILEKK